VNPVCFAKATKSSTAHKAEYVLAVGKIEKFPPGAMARTDVALPKLKR
jgi:hypothetical protein